MILRVKSAITTKQAAKFYGLSADENGMIPCPFHAHKAPLMKVDKRYYCFHCHRVGDVIDFTARLFHLTYDHAAVKLAHDFGLDPNTPASSLLTACPGKEPFTDADDDAYAA